MGKEDKTIRQSEPIDLSSLESINIEPEWAKKSTQKNYEKGNSGTRPEGRKKHEHGKNTGPRKK